MTSGEIHKLSINRVGRVDHREFPTLRISDSPEFSIEAQKHRRLDDRLPVAYDVPKLDRILDTKLEQRPAALSVDEKRELMGRLLARLAHEIRNPLSSLDIHVQLLQEDLDNLASGKADRTTSRFDIIHGELHRLKKIVENFLRLAGPSVVDLEAIEVPTLVKHVCSLLGPEAAARRIILRSQLNEPLPRVSADPVRLTQVLLNLVINGLQAVKESGTVEVEVSGTATELLLVVKDTGPGIPVDQLNDIFDPFFTTKAEGSGLGLWIAQQIVNAHGGTLSAGNLPGGGATFTVCLPIQPGETVVVPLSD